MKKISDEQLDKMLSEYCEAESTEAFVFDADHKKEKIIPFWKNSRMVAAAAGFILVSILSITLFFTVVNKASTPIAVAPSPKESSAPETTAGESGSLPTEYPNGITFSTESGGVSSSEPYTPPATDAYGHILPTEKSQAPTTTVNETSVPSTSPKPTDGARESPTEPTPPKPTEHTPTPTEGEPAVPVNPTEPLEPPWNLPTEPFDPPWWIEETEPPGAGEPWLVPDYPSPVEAVIQTSKLNGSSDVYCKVFNSSGRRLGSRDLYDQSHAAQITYQTAQMTSVCYYIPEEVSYSMNEGEYYNYVFYGSDGKVLTQVQTYYG